MSDVKRYIRIEVISQEEKINIGTKIHEQLIGNPDYIASHIVLNIDDPLAVQLWFFNECEHIPEIKI